MPDTANFQCVCVLFALPEETAPFLAAHRLDPEKGANGAKVIRSAWHSLGRSPKGMPTPPRPIPLRIACTGTGAVNASRGAALMLDACSSVQCLIVCGFAGGLSPHLRPGHLILVERVVEQVSGRTYRADSALLVAAESVPFSPLVAQRGMLITTDRIVTTAIEKRALANGLGALALDMETAGAARVAQERNVPWLAVRVITDGIDDDLPLDFNAYMDADGNVDRGRVVRAALSHPWKLPALIRLGARSSRAAGNLATFLETFLQHLPEGPTT